MRKAKAGEEHRVPDGPGAAEAEPVTELNEERAAADEPSAVIEPAAGELEETIGRLGAAVAREEGSTGGYDISGKAHESAIDRMEGMADNIDLVLPSLVANVRDFLIDVIKSRPKPWGATSAAEQRDVAAACEHLSDGLVRQIVETIRADGRQAVRVLLTKVTLGDDTQIVGKLKALAPEEEDAAVMMLHHARGKHVLLTVASVDDYKQDHRSAKTAEEEPPLPFESGGHPADDSDLVEAADRNEDLEEMQESGELQLLRTGERMDIPEHGDCELVVNVKTGMIEATPVSSSGLADRFDVREATPAELAAERERVADFDTEDEEEEAEAEA